MDGLIFAGDSGAYSTGKLHQQAHSVIEGNIKLYGKTSNVATDL